MNRRTALRLMGLSALTPSLSAPAAEPRRVTRRELDVILETPVLLTEFVAEPVTVESIELLRRGSAYLLRTRSKAGVEVVTIPHQQRLRDTAPIFLRSIAPFFVGKDARQLDSLLWDVYRHASNYKLQGIALWVGVAAVETALIELMAQTAKRPFADFFGPVRQRDISVYVASGNRGNAPEAEIEHLQGLVNEYGARALKWRAGGRMSRNVDSAPSRTERLVSLVRETFGDAFTLYADANSSYDVANGIRVGRLMQESNYGFFEEPCEFDDLWSTKEVADSLTLPIAGGEQEYSLHRWRWMIENRAVDIAQPDLHYGGGFIRATKVARMAAAAGLTVAPHMSGGGLGHVDVLHFASFTPNIGPFMEFKGNSDLPVHCTTSSLKCDDGKVRCPQGIGYGVTLDSDFVKRTEVVRLPDSG